MQRFGKKYVKILSFTVAMGDTSHWPLLAYHHPTIMSLIIPPSPPLLHISFLIFVYMGGLVFGGEIQYLHRKSRLANIVHQMCFIWLSSCVGKLKPRLLPVSYLLTVCINYLFIPAQHSIMMTLCLRSVYVSLIFALLKINISYLFSNYCFYIYVYRSPGKT